VGGLCERDILAAFGDGEYSNQRTARETLQWLR
jgi:hypothetical protein